VSNLNKQFEGHPTVGRLCVTVEPSMNIDGIFIAVNVNDAAYREGTHITPRVAVCMANHLLRLAKRKGKIKCSTTAKKK
jgi:hypothetical protein